MQEIAPQKYHRRLERFETWVDPFADPIDTGYQTVQSLYAIGSGGITGVGIGKSKQKLGFIPDSQNDMIFCIICEEFGLVGAVVLLSIFVFLIWRMILVARHAPDYYSSFLTFGILAIIALQVIVNVGVVTGTIPNTGQPLPFISYGGTSLLMFMAAMGMVLNVSRYSDY
ncbi:MAG: FtsW/RodA/SpoVE family cell cycle protein [Clostridia bacterium]|nr:FtsW/RodA/SpoVE family cell cycle protein [Clostridia bacterium]